MDATGYAQPADIELNLSQVLAQGRTEPIRIGQKSTTKGRSLERRPPHLEEGIGPLPDAGEAIVYV
jgi:hypothetical protein